MLLKRQEATFHELEAAEAGREPVDVSEICDRHLF
jgi:hypothetical protein